MADIVDVVGAGRIGHGIAACVAAHGYRVRLRDVKERPSGEEWTALQRARQQITRSLSLLWEEGLVVESVEDMLSRIEFVRALDGVEEAFHVVEALPEDLTVKARLLPAISGKMGRDSVLASTSSSIRPSQMAAYVRNPSCFLVTHWINPAELIPLVEVVPSDKTLREKVEETVGFLKSCGKVPAVCGDSPGYVSARLQAVLMNEALRIVEEGVAPPAEVDKALMAGIGFRLAVQGLLEFVDWGGVDILHRVSSYLERELGNPRYSPPKLLNQLVQQGCLGMDAGRGVYDYRGVDVEMLKDGRKRQMARHLKQLKDLGVGILR